MALYPADFLKHCKIQGGQIICDYGGKEIECDANATPIGEDMKVLKCKESMPFDLLFKETNEPQKIVRTPEKMCIGTLGNDRMNCVGGESSQSSAHLGEVRFRAESSAIDQNLIRFISNFSLLDPKSAEQVSVRINRVVDDAIKKDFRIR